MKAFNVTVAELQSHHSPSDCWVAIDSKVWDVSEFVALHPGGSEIILRYAGADATRAYESIHAPGLLQETLSLSKFIGHVNIPRAITLPTIIETQVQPASRPDLSSLISAHDFEEVAAIQFTPKAWAFYSSAATDLITHRLNKSILRKIMIRPRILRDVADIATKCRILGVESSVPFFISPAAMAVLAHKDGELALARGAANEQIIQCISSNASHPLGNIVKAGIGGPGFFLQLYVNSDRSKTEILLRNAKSLGIRAIFVTVDAPVAGKREADERVAALAVTSAISGAQASNDRKGGGMGRLMATYVDKSLTWQDLAWIRRVSRLPIVLKGVQSAGDARMAVEYGVEGIMLSNHGGRSLDTAQPAILILLELRKLCPEVFQSLEVYIDGGFERGTDILKALALGATAVGIGRPYLYSLGYGQGGVEHLTQILRDELETSMRLCGLTDIKRVQPGLVNTRGVDSLVSLDMGDDQDRFSKIRPRLQKL